MKQYKVVLRPHFRFWFEVYELIPGFFGDVWKEVGDFQLNDSQKSIVEQATDFIHSKKIYYFEA